MSDSYTRLVSDIRRCTKCADVCHPCIPPVINDAARVMIVARNPGRTEHALQSEPFHPKTPSGRLLDSMLTRIGLARNDVWITNCVLGHTTNDRPPREDEIANCRPFLERQIELLQPSVIAALGVSASSTLLKQPYSWKRDHGIPKSVTFNGAMLTVVPMTHTGQALRGIYHELQSDFDVLHRVLND